MTRSRRERAAAMLQAVGRSGTLPAGFASRVGWQYAATVYTTFAGFAYAILLARALGRAQYGLVALALGFASITFQMVELRLHEAVIRFVGESWATGDHRRTVALVKTSLLADAGSGAFALALTLVLAPVLQPAIVGMPHGTAILVLAGLVTFCANVATATANGVLRVFGQYRTFAVVTAAGASAKLAGAGIAIWWFRGDARAVMIAAVVTAFLTNSCLLGSALRHMSRAVSIRWREAPVALLVPERGAIWAFVRSAYLLSLTTLPTKELDVNLLGRFVPLEIIGAYKIAKSFMAALWAVTDTSFHVIYPELARMRALGASTQIMDFTRRLTVVLGIAGLALWIGASLVVPYVITFTTGTQYAGAGGYFRLMAWSVAVWAPFLWVNPLILASGRPEILLRAAAVAGIVILGLALLLISRAGASGAALAYALGTPITLLSVWWFARQAGILPLMRDVASAAMM